MDNINNGLITKIWGPGLWIGLHSISFGYPIHPTIEQKRDYKNFFTSVGDVLPCKYCRVSYKKFISKGNTKLDDSVMENRYTLTRWLYLIHEAVNKKLGVNYGITYNDVVNRYETYRATCVPKDKLSNDQKGCIKPLNDKNQCYKISHYKECNIIPICIAKQFIEYAKLRGLDDIDLKFIESCKKDKINKDINCVAWNKRNKICCDIISRMRINSIQSIELEGKWEGLPTIEELKLILRLSSNLPINELLNIIDKLNRLKELHNIYKINKKYKINIS